MRPEVTPAKRVWDARRAPGLPCFFGAWQDRSISQGIIPGPSVFAIILAGKTCKGFALVACQWISGYLGLMAHGAKMWLA